MIRVPIMATELVAGARAVVAAVAAWEVPTVVSLTDARLLAEFLLVDAPPTHLTIITDRATAAAVTDVSYLAWSLAEHLESSRLDLYVEDADRPPSIAVSDGALIALVVDGATPAGVLTTDHERLRHQVKAQLESRIEDTVAIVAHGPTMTEVETEFAARFGADVAARYRRCLDELWPAVLNGSAVDAVSTAVVVVASANGWLHDLGAWGRAVGIATEADFSRAKAELESAGVIEVVEESRGVGRPRQRLTLRHDMLESSDRDEFRTIARVLSQ